MANVILFRSHIADQPGSIVLKGIPLGVLSLAAYLEDRRGDDVKIVDLNLEPELTGHIKGIIESFAPDIVGISSYSVSSSFTHEIASRVKDFDSGIPVVVGGPYASASPRRVMSDPNVNYVVVGEGEKALTALLDAIERQDAPLGIPGIVWRGSDEEIICDHSMWPVEDLDSLPFVAYHKIDLNKYFRAPSQTYWIYHKRRVPILTTRGCPYECAYCFHIHGESFRHQRASIFRRLFQLRPGDRHRDIGSDRTKRAEDQDLFPQRT